MLRLRCIPKGSRLLDYTFSKKKKKTIKITPNLKLIHVSNLTVKRSSSVHVFPMM